MKHTALRAYRHAENMNAAPRRAVPTKSHISTTMSAVMAEKNLIPMTSRSLLHSGCSGKVMPVATQEGAWPPMLQAGWQCGGKVAGKWVHRWGNHWEGVNCSGIKVPPAHTARGRPVTHHAVRWWLWWLPPVAAAAHPPVVCLFRLATRLPTFCLVVAGVFSRPSDRLFYLSMEAVKQWRRVCVSTIFRLTLS